MAPRKTVNKNVVAYSDQDDFEQEGGVGEMSQNSIKREFTQNSDYLTISQHELVLKRPNIFVGSVEPHPRVEWMLDFGDDEKKMKMVEVHTDISPGLAHLYTEILDNASDSCRMARECGKDAGRIDVLMDNLTICITSIGNGMLVEESVNHPGVYIPTMSFGILNTSTNYNDGKNTAGRTGVGANGLGSKAVNILSTYFEVEVGDPINGRLFNQVWRNNMYDVDEATISDYTDVVPYVKTTFQADFARMGLSEYPPETQALFARRLLDTAFALGVPCSFNGRNFELMGLVDYASLYFDYIDDTTSMLVHYEYPPGTSCVGTIIRGHKVLLSKDPSIVPTTQILVIDSPANSRHISFANTLYMREGGVHIDETYKAVSDYIINKIDPDSLSLKTKKKLNVGKTALTKNDNKPIKPKSLKLTVADIKKHTSLFIVCNVRNPTWGGATKEKLVESDPPFSVKFKESELERMLKWELRAMLEGELKFKNKQALSKIDGTKGGSVFLEKYKKANCAGGPRSSECTVWFAEGDSPMTYCLFLIDEIAGGHDLNGVFPLRGVPLNVMNCSEDQLIKPLGIVACLKKILGIKEHVDYSTDRSQLRYGRVVMCADSDIDGMHILGLTLLIFYHLYPSLISMFHFLRTPIILASRGKKVIKFYTEEAFEEWARKARDSGELTKYNIRYLKGLASSEKEEAQAELADLKIVSFTDDRPKSANMMNLAFHSSLADKRKEWIARPVQVCDLADVNPLNISEFIDLEMIKFSRHSLRRMLPCWDGLKEVQQKIVEGCMHHWGVKCGNEAKPLLIDRLVAEVSLATAYKNGPTSMAGAITHMGFSFVGGHNLPLLYPKGNGGTRVAMGADAGSSRYVSVYPQWFWKYLFDKRDQPILTYIFEEGQNTQPEVWLPIVPLVLINGCNSIATGWSSFIPNHNPIDVIDWLIARITDQPLPTLIPWYRGFTGTIDIRKTGSKKSVDKTPLPPAPEIAYDEYGNVIEDLSAAQDHEMDSDSIFEQHDSDDDTSESGSSDKPSKPVRYSMVTEGIWRKTPRGVHVTELPIGRSTISYMNWLKDLEKQHLIKGYNGRSKTDTIDFEIIEPKFPITTESLRLKKSLGMGNFVVVGTDGRPIKFADAQDLIEQWFNWRLPFYSKRKMSLISIANEEIKNTQNKIDFITLVVEGTIEVRNKSKSHVQDQMIKHSIPTDVLGKVKLTDQTIEEIESLHNHQLSLVEKKKEIESTEPTQMWLDDLVCFRAALQKHYGVKTKKVSPAMPATVESGDFEDDANDN